MQEKIRNHNNIINNSNTPQTEPENSLPKFNSENILIPENETVSETSSNQHENQIIIKSKEESIFIPGSNCNSEIVKNPYENVITPKKNQEKENQFKNEKDKENTINGQKGNDSFTNILPVVSIPTPFKESLFWPEPTASKKFQARRQIKLPSVGTSDAWREYYIKKEERQKKLEEEKETRKRKREENKILRLNMEKKVPKSSKNKEIASKTDAKEQSTNYEKPIEADQKRIAYTMLGITSLLISKMSYTLVLLLMKRTKMW